MKRLAVLLLLLFVVTTQAAGAAQVGRPAKFYQVTITVHSITGSGYPITRRRVPRGAVRKLTVTLDVTAQKPALSPVIQVRCGNQHENGWYQIAEQTYTAAQPMAAGQTISGVVVITYRPRCNAVAVTARWVGSTPGVKSKPPTWPLHG